MSLTPEAISLIKSNTRLQNQLAVEFDRCETTIKRWIKANHKNLSSGAALRFIEQETGINKSQLLAK